MKTILTVMTILDTRTLVAIGVSRQALARPRSGEKADRSFRDVASAIVAKMMASSSGRSHLTIQRRTGDIARSWR